MLDFYNSRADGRGVLSVEQDWTEAEIHTRAANFERVTVRDKDAMTDVPGLGESGPLKQFYKLTPLFRD